MKIIISNSHNTEWGRRVSKQDRMKFHTDPDVIFLRCKVETQEVSLQEIHNLEIILRARYKKLLLPHATARHYCWFDWIDIVEINEPFMIEEYDGLETIRLKSEIEWINPKDFE